MKKLLFALLLVVNQAQAQLDGSWLNRALQADARVSAKTANNSDGLDAMYLSGYLAGVLSSQAGNTMQTVTIFSVVTNKTDEQSKTMSAVATLYSPLMLMPDTLRSDQIYTIIRNYLEKNPKRWNLSAQILVIDALKEAYPRPSQ